MLSLIRLAMFCFIIYLVYKLVKWIILSPVLKGRDMSGHQVSARQGEDLVEDPYCHMYVPLSQAYKASIDGQYVYFCSQKCFEQYTEEQSTKKAQGAA